MKEDCRDRRQLNVNGGEKDDKKKKTQKAEFDFKQEEVRRVYT